MLGRAFTSVKVLKAVKKRLKSKKLEFYSEKTIS